VEGANHGDENDDEHDEHINAQAPQQQTRAEGKFTFAETCAGLCGNDLVGFEQRQNNIRILKVRPLGVRRRRLGFLRVASVLSILWSQFDLVSQLRYALTEGREHAKHSYFT